MFRLTWTLLRYFTDVFFQGFFTLYRNLFSRLAQEEAMLSDIEYPQFGYSTWSWASPTIPSEAVKNFYSAWLNFSTVKEFMWMDHYNTLDAPDRRTRRSDFPII